MSRPTIAARIFLQLLRKAHHGTLHVDLPDGKREIFGSGTPPILVTVKDWVVFDTLFRKGDIGLAEVIISGDLVVDDISALVQWACLNDQELSNALHGVWYGTVIHKIKNLMNYNSRSGSRQNIMAHYDLGNEFYRLWLDRSMTYSSGIFNDSSDSLEKAQVAKYDRLIDGLNIKSSDHVLEIGCGWGGFFSRAVERTGCKVTAVMNSPSQARHNRQLIESKCFQGQVDLKEIDYRDIDGKYDKIVSIEMIEAVGEQYWDAFFGKINSSLRAKGLAMIQGITIREDLFSTYRKQTDFIQQYVFPGGMLLTNNTFKTKGSEHGMHLFETFEFANSYAETLKIWKQNFDKAKAEVVLMGFDEKFIRLWNLYLSYCEGAFRAERINVGQFLLQKY